MHALFSTSSAKEIAFATGEMTGDQCLDEIEKNNLFYAR